jgi:AcrR family transcriptional regulator
MPIVAAAFAELGYRRATTAELAERCGVRENILYRLWADKKAMFIAAIDYVYEHSVAVWGRLLAAPGADTSGAERLLAHESQHHGEFGLYRILFAGLSETDDADIRVALGDVYRRYQKFITDRVRDHRAGASGADGPDASLVSWAVIGLGTVANITRELRLVSDRQRRRMLAEIGQELLTGCSERAAKIPE